MIPLRIRIDIEGPHRGKRVIKLVSDLAKEVLTSPSLTSGNCAELVATFPSERVFKWGDHYIRIKGNAEDEIVGDVCLFNFEKGYADRLIRGNSKHNTLVVTEQCDQLCIMCSQPPKKTHHDQFHELYHACLLADSGKIIGISGGEPTLYKEELFSLIKDVNKQRPDLQFHILTNAQHFSVDDLEYLKSFRGNVLWAVPLYAAHPVIHDTIVAKAGAYERLLASLSLLVQAGAQVELRTVVMQQNISELPDIAKVIKTHLPFIQHWAIMQLENIGFARNRWSKTFFDHSIDFSGIAAAAAYTLASGIETRFFNFPLCTIPPAWRPYAEQTISDWKQRFDTPCLNCSVQEQCGGFFEWHPSARSYEAWGEI
jgi:His-Xaa-Ser system radical SAM maturase HxsC